MVTVHHCGEMDSRKRAPVALSTDTEFSRYIFKQLANSTLRMCAMNCRTVAG